MFFSMLAVGLAGYGYVTGDTWVIVAGVVVSVIGLRKAVFSFDRIGALANFVILIAGVVLGALNFTNVKLPSFPDVGTNKREVAKQVTPPPSISKQPAVSAPIINPPPPPEPVAPPRYNPSVIGTKSNLPCAEQTHLKGVVFGKKKFPDDMYVKICRHTKEIKISYMSNYKFTVDLWRDQTVLPTGQKLVNVTIEEEKGIVKLSPQLEVMKTTGAQYVIVHLNISTYE